LTKIGTGYVSVDADLTPFWRQIDRELAGGDARFKKAGRSAGRAFGDGFSGAQRDVTGLRSSLSGLDRDSRKAQKGFSGLAASFGGGGDNVNRFARDLDDFGGAAGGATATIGGFKIAIGAIIPVLVSFSGAAIAAASSLGPLIGLAAAAGNGLAAAAQGLGVFKLATAGISDALKEQTTNQTQVASAAISSASQQRSAARTIQSAQDGVRDALAGVQDSHDGVRDAAEALADAEHDLSDAQRDAVAVQKKLSGARTQARRALVDMHAAVAEAILDERTAVLELGDAAETLAALQTGPTQDDLADGSRAVTEAIHNQEQAVISLHRAQESLDELMGRAAGNEQRRADAAAALTRAQEHQRRVDADINATYDERTRALQLLADATTASREANAAVAASNTDKAQALQDVTSAQDALVAAQANAIATQKALAALQAGPSDDDKQRALLEQEQAELRLAEIRRERIRLEKDAAAADKAGVEGSQDVVDAKAAIVAADERVQDAERGVRDAHRAVTDAQRDVVEAQRAVVRAHQALSDAQLSANESMLSGAAATAAMNDKMNALPASTQAFVKQLIAMKPRLDELRTTAADGFFPGATAGLRAAMGSFTSVNKVVAQTSSVLGDAAQKSGELVGSPAFGRDIETIGGRNAKVIETMGEALRHVISALRHVMVAAGPLTQWLADTANKWALNAAEAAKAGRESGRLAAFFEKTRAIAERLGSIIGHLTSGLLGIGKAGKVSGDQIWASIDRAAGRFDAWANSAKGQTALHDFFRRSSELAAALLPVMGGITSAIAALVLKTLPLAHVLNLLGPYADEATTAFIAYKLAVIATGLATKIATGAVWLHNAALAVQSVNMVRWRILIAAAAIQTGVMTAAQWALNVALRANPIGLVITALVALVAGLIYAYHESETFRAIIDAAFKGVTMAFGWVLNAAQNVFGWLKTNWPLVLAILTGPIGLAVLAIARHWDTIKIAAQTAWNAIKSAAATTWDAIKTAIVTPIRLARDIIGDVVTGIANRLASGWETIKGAAGSAWATIRDLVLTPIRAARDLIPDVMSGLVNRVQTGWDTVTKGVKNFAGDVKDKIEAAFKGAANLVIGFVNKIIWAINKIPGVPEIKEIEKLAEGGTFGGGTSGGGTGGPNGTGRLARGGAFGRTGGLINHPITLMGEEAPRWPEIVIPTNPAYRDRARALLAHVAGTIGFAKGGRYSVDDMAALAKGVGASAPRIMGAIGMAESSGDPAAHGPPDGRGLWQIEWPVWARTMTGRGLSNAYDPSQNARMMKIVQDMQGLTAWVVYNTGAYKRYLDGDDGGGLLGKIGGAISSVGGVMGDLLSKGAGFLLDQLPGVGNLPDWLKGTGKYVLGKAGDWIKDKVSGLVGGGGSSGGPGVMTGTNAKAEKLARMFGATITSAYRTPAQNAAANGAAGSSHKKGSPSNPGAHDFVPASSELLAEALKMGAKWVDNHDFGSGLHSHVSWFRQGGQFGGLPPYRGTFHTGGIVGGPTGAPASITALGGEALIPDGVGLVGQLQDLTAEIRAMRQSGMPGVMNEITDHVLERGGQHSHRRRMTAGNPATTAIVS